MKSSNGTVERANRIVHQYLRLVNAGNLWNRYLSFMCHANNSSICTATGEAPCVLFYGRQFVFNREFQALRHEVANLKAEEWDPLTDLHECDNFELGKFSEFLNDWDVVRERASEKDVAQKRQEKRRFERKRRADKVPVIAKGMRVLLEANPDVSGHKDRDLYEGPEGGYEVVHADPDGLNVTILDGDVERTVHAERLRFLLLAKLFAWSCLFPVWAIQAAQWHIAFILWGDLIVILCPLTICINILISQMLAKWRSSIHIGQSLFHGLQGQLWHIQQEVLGPEGGNRVLPNPLQVHQQQECIPCKILVVAVGNPQGLGYCVDLVVKD